MNKHTDIFTNIYENCIWGDNNNNNYKGTSGEGSSIEYNKEVYIPFLQNFIKDNQITKIVDLGCGDFRCGPEIYDNLDVIYYGYDAYQKVIEHNKINNKPIYNFIHLDFYNNIEKVNNADLCILKDILQHWSLIEIYKFLDYIGNNKKFKYVLICNCCGQTENNTDIKTGDFRPLSCDFFPLKRYRPIKLLNYNGKEISLIKFF